MVKRTDKESKRHLYATIYCNNLRIERVQVFIHQQIKCDISSNGILFSHKKNYVLILATTWMNLENIMLSEMSQIERINTV
jgi:hypothetical protein